MKLVRDKIPEIIENDGKWCLCRSVHGQDEHMLFLKKKIIEETDEFLLNPCIEEAADIYEVFMTFCFLTGLNYESVVSAAINKRNARGGFRDGIILESINENT